MVTIEHDFAVRSARQLMAVDQGIARIDVSLAVAAPACVVISVAQVGEFAIVIPQVDPGHLDIANVVVPITRIEVHGFRLSELVERPAIHGLMAVDRVGWNAVLANGHHAQEPGAVLSAVTAPCFAPTAYAAFGR